MEGLVNNKRTERYRDDEEEEPSIIVRFHFIRHGETQANKAGLALGQTESDLTDLGVRQALLARKHHLNRPIPNDMEEEEEENANLSDKDPPTKLNSYWRIYHSDLSRAYQTAKIIMFGSDHRDGHHSHLTLIPDVRLREMAKGAREGRPKSLSYDEALSLHQKEQKDKVNGGMVIRPLETEDEVWIRIQQWMSNVIEDVKHDHQKRSKTIVRKKYHYNILAVTHAGWIRIASTHLVPEELPSDVVISPVSRDGATGDMLHIPNLSLTVIDGIVANGDDLGVGEREYRLIRLADVSHLKKL